MIAISLFEPEDGGQCLASDEGIGRLAEMPKSEKPKSEMAIARERPPHKSNSLMAATIKS